ncbi:DUF4422 domain-containing protein [Campylobacter upsaliensis]|nr:DUF4422 domain-containing protein [Campylobacter upsaliensis]ELS3708502.1 DUF4422 domain-containing protein [Campylobacter upsaliensis]
MMKKRSENKNPSVKILIGYHKPAVLVKDDVLTPIHLGRALATEASKDGEMSQEDFEWMCENMIGDDTGDNISHLNRYLNELTGIYWAWKNYDKLGNPDYIGYMHYRRHFVFADHFAHMYNLDKHHSYFLNIKQQDDIYFSVINPKNFKKVISDNDIIIPKLFKTNNYFFDCVKTDKENMKDYFSTFYPYSFFYDIYYCYLCKAREFKDNNSLLFDINSKPGHYPCNMFILKKDIFFQYCDFLFNIVFNIFHDVKWLLKNEKDLFIVRGVAYISENITDIFLKYMIYRNCKYKQLYLSIIYNDMFGASDRVKNHLSYKIGMKFLKATNFVNIIKLPFAILSICLKHKKDQAVYNSMIRVNPKLALFPLESYADYNEALRITNYLSYRLGNAFIKHPITFIFRIYGIYQKWKKEKRGNEK